MHLGAFAALGPLWQLTLVLELCALGICDLLYRRVGNAIIGVVLLSGLAAQLLARGPQGLVAAIAAASLVFVLTFGLWLFGLVGAADVKMAAALAACAGLEHLAAYLIYTCLMAGALGLAVGIASAPRQRGITGWLVALCDPHALERVRGTDRSVPVAVALGVGLLWSLQATG